MNITGHMEPSLNLVQVGRMHQNGPQVKLEDSLNLLKRKKLSKYAKGVYRDLERRQPSSQALAYP